MKTTSKTQRLALLTAIALPAAPFLLAQGPLTPPGAPAPTMKTLDQVEARKPISAAGAITQPGSYYLTGNIIGATGNGITIVVDNVTLDLNGFTISSAAVPASGSGIALSTAHRNITIRNGNIKGNTTFFAGVFTAGGFTNGINHTTVPASAANIRISDINVLGVAGDGIDLGNRTTPTFIIERCTASVCGGSGMIAALVRDSAADTTGGTAIHADIAIHCSGETVAASGASLGISVLSVADSCRGVSITGTGLGAISASNCIGISTSGTGLSASVAQNCEGTSTSGSFGLDAGLGGIASFCRGKRDGGVALRAFNAIGCNEFGTGTITATNKSLGTP